eukprot:765180-Hanusia_phi.AAC.5
MHVPSSHARPVAKQTPAPLLQGKLGHPTHRHVSDLLDPSSDIYLHRHQHISPPAPSSSSSSHLCRAAQDGQDAPVDQRPVAEAPPPAAVPRGDERRVHNLLRVQRAGKRAHDDEAAVEHAHVRDCPVDPQPQGEGAIFPPACHTRPVNCPPSLFTLPLIPHRQHSAPADLRGSRRSLLGRASGHRPDAVGGVDGEAEGGGKEAERPGAAGGRGRESDEASCLEGASSRACDGDVSHVDGGGGGRGAREEFAADVDRHAHPAEPARRDARELSG